MILPRLGRVAERLVDAFGREVLLRGANLGGDSKVPYPDGGTDRPTDFRDHREVSFVGRPFPLAEADVHLDRLRRFGFNCVRLLTSWEAIEHRGPGLYDEAYLDFFREVSRRAGVHGLYVIVDFHQDVWSRMTGGDGAPGWTLESVGIDLEAIDASDAALVMQRRYDYADPRPRQEERYPRMSWIWNYQYPANAIMWTLFFGGRDFAPGLRVEGVDVQEWLQGRYLGSQRALAERVADLPNVVGFGTLNEPSRGWIGVGMSVRPSVDREAGGAARPGLAWSPLLGLAAASGQQVRLDDYRISLLRGGCAPVGEVIANPGGRPLWRPGFEDPFRAAGAWSRDARGAPRSEREDYFQRVEDRSVDFERDYLCPFFHRVASTVRAVNPEWLVFIEKDAGDAFDDPTLPAPLPTDAVHAGHWYDVILLLTKRRHGAASFDVTRGRPALGRAAIERMYTRQLARLQRASERAGGCPTLIGEFGIPFDLNRGRAYAAHRAGDRGPRPWRQHVEALDAMYDALDRLRLSATIWNYSASNRNHARVGDRWNQEDLSIFSQDQQVDPSVPESGGRALEGFVRPYARAVQGRLLAQRFERGRGRFTLEIDVDPAVDAPTEIFVPRLQFPDGFSVEAQGLIPEVELEAQLLRLRGERAGPHRVAIRRRR